MRRIRLCLIYPEANTWLVDKGSHRQRCRYVSHIAAPLFPLYTSLLPVLSMLPVCSTSLLVIHACSTTTTSDTCMLYHHYQCYIHALPHHQCYIHALPPLPVLHTCSTTPPVLLACSTTHLRLSTRKSYESPPTKEMVSNGKIKQGFDYGYDTFTCFLGTCPRGP